jgi:hypothetical protein
MIDSKMSSVRLFLYFIHRPCIIPCRFSGIFYVQKNKRGLSTLFFDAFETPRELKINYFSDIDDARISPFTETYTNIEADKVYLMRVVLFIVQDMRFW